MILNLIIFLLLSNALTIRRDQSILFSRIVAVNLLGMVYISWTASSLVALEKGLGIFGGIFSIDALTQSFQMFVIFISAIIISLTSFYPKIIYIQPYVSSFLKNFWSQPLKPLNIYKKSQEFRIIEYPLIIIFIICGALFLIACNDLISVFLSIELQSYGLYILCTLYRNSESATASGLTYFLLGGLSSCFILLGSSLLYINTGSTNLENIYVISNLILTDDTALSTIWYQSYYLHLSLIILSVGFLFKVSAAPFHFWSPDVYDGIPTIVTTYVAIIAKISIFAFFLELVYYIEKPLHGFDWKSTLLLSSFFSLIVGSLLGLTQSRLKRLYAYSTISHVGFILLALSIKTVESIKAYIFYILQYSFTNLNAFVILLSFGHLLTNFKNGSGANESNSNSTSRSSMSPIADERKDNKDEEKKQENINRENSPIQLVKEIKGLFGFNSFIAVSFALTLFSFAGIPPLIGFFGKQMILSAALDSGYVFLAFVAILASVISAAYYLNLIKEVFFFTNDTSNEKAEIQFSENYVSISQIDYKNDSGKTGKKIEVKGRYILSGSITGLISLITLLLVIFMFVPQEWLNMVDILSLILFRH